MFKQLISFGQLLISGLSIPSLQPNKKRVVGKKLSKLHCDLTLLYENGSSILGAFSDYNNGVDIDIDEIKKLLLGQRFLIQQLLQFFENQDVQTIFSIRAPEIKPLQLLLFEKGFRVKFYLNEIDEKEKQYSESDKIEWIRPRARVEVPDQDSIDHSQGELDKINRIAEKLRVFIIDNFDINEII